MDNLQRFLKESEAMTYTGLSRSGLRTYCAKIGATRHLGTAVRYDRVVIDDFLSNDIAPPRKRTVVRKEM